MQIINYNGDQYTYRAAFLRSSRAKYMDTLSYPAHSLEEAIELAHIWLDDEYPKMRALTVKRVPDPTKPSYIMTLQPVGTSYRIAFTRYNPLELVQCNMKTEFPEVLYPTIEAADARMHEIFDEYNDRSSVYSYANWLMGA